MSPTQAEARWTSTLTSWARVSFVIGLEGSGSGGSAGTGGHRYGVRSRSLAGIPDRCGARSIAEERSPDRRHRAELRRALHGVRRMGKAALMRLRLGRLVRDRALGEPVLQQLLRAAHERID